jgi:ABC-type glycerol-3-phosphate transport system substrate-binding protein
MSLVLNVEILGEFRKLTTATQGAQSNLQNLQDRVGGVAKGISRAVGGLALALGFTGIVQGFKQSIQAAEEAAVANQRIDAIAESMDEFGNQTAKVTKRIKDFADANEFSLGVDGDVIKATQAKLLTFRELTKTADVMGGSFDRATIAALDMAAAGFGEATSNATQLGKALNDPIAGITALNRAGIQFTDDQKSLIKSLVESGDMLQAQEIILREIENQVGGTAEATATSSERMTIAFGMVQEKIGNVLMPAFDSLAEWFVEVLPEIERFGNGLVGALDDPKVQKAISDMQTSLGNLGITIGTLFGSTETDEAKGFMNFWIGLSGIIQFLATSLDSLLAPINAAFGNTQPMENYLDRLFGLIPGYSEYSGFMQRRDAITPAPGALPPLSVTNNIQVKTDATAQEIANAINRANKASGTNLIRNFQ